MQSSVLIRKLCNVVEQLSIQALVGSTYTSAQAAEVAGRMTRRSWTNERWVEIALNVGSAPPSLMERRQVSDVFDARARVLRLELFHYRVTFYAGGQVRQLFFLDYEQARDHARKHELHGMAPAPIDVLERISATALYEPVS